MNIEQLTTALAQHMPPVLRWAGGIAKGLRRFDISLGGQKSSGFSNTDALTLADLTVQELVVAALRDGDPLFRQCRIEAEEDSGDLGRFAADAEFTIALDPIDGTKQYRDREGNGYSVMLHVRSRDAVHYSLVFIPETGPDGTWVEAAGTRIVCGPDDPAQSARDVLDRLNPIDLSRQSDSKKIYLIGFFEKDAEKAALVTQAGLEGVVADEAPGCLYDLMSRGEFIGSLIHTPNVYDYPVSLQIARALGGDSVWVHDGRPVHFGETWEDERAHMLRLPGIVATSANPDVLKTLCDVARNWNPRRYG